MRVSREPRPRQARHPAEIDAGPWKGLASGLYFTLAADGYADSIAIDKALSATRVGHGWALQVGWEGYPDPTIEPLSATVRCRRHRNALSDMVRCQAEFLARHGRGLMSADMHIPYMSATPRAFWAAAAESGTPPLPSW